MDEAILGGADMIERLLPSIFFVFIVNLYKHIKRNGFEFDTKEVIMEFVEWGIAFIGVLIVCWLITARLMEAFWVTEVNPAPDLSGGIGLITSVIMNLYRSLTVVSKK